MKFDIDLFLAAEYEKEQNEKDFNSKYEYAEVYAPRPELEPEVTEVEVSYEIDNYDLV